MNKRKLMRVRVRVTLVGDACTHKNHLAHHWTSPWAPPEDPPPLFVESYFRDCEVGDQTVGIEVVSTAGHEEYKARRVMYPGADVFLLLFSYDSVESLNHVSSIWAPEIKEYGCESPVFMLVGVGDKLIREDWELLEAMGESPFGECPVKNEMVQKVMEDIGADAFMYCSKCMPDSSRRVVRKAAEIYLEKKKQQEAEAKKKEEEKAERKKHKRRWWQKKDKGEK